MAATEESDWSGEVNKVRKILIKPGGAAQTYFFYSRGKKQKNTKSCRKNYYENYVNFKKNFKLLAENISM